MVQNRERYAVILAGGSGARLWPLSRSCRPKQLIPFAGTTTLLELTVARIRSPEQSQMRCLVATSQKYEQDVRATVGMLVDEILVEPAPRNTAPAILLSCMHISAQDPSATVLFLPADHYIQQTEEFYATVTQACNLAEASSNIVLIGVQQSYVTTNFGFIERGTQLNCANEETPAYTVRRFHEKPSLERAEQYASQANFFWNSGIVCAPVSVVLKAFETYAPDLVAGIHDYASLPACSFDYRILEHADNINMLIGKFDWVDLGNLTTFIPASTKKSQTIELAGAHNNLVQANKPVIISELSNLCVVLMDDLLVIMPRTAAGTSEAIARQIALQGMSEFI